MLEVQRDLTISSVHVPNSQYVRDFFVVQTNEQHYAKDELLKWKNYPTSLKRVHLKIVPISNCHLRFGLPLPVLFELIAGSVIGIGWCRSTAPLIITGALFGLCTVKGIMEKPRAFVVCIT